MLKNLRSEVMPPAGEKRPSKEELETIAEWVKFDVFGINPDDPTAAGSASDDSIAVNTADVDKYYLTCFAKFLEKMSKIEDADGNSMLHNSMIVYGGAIADG